MESLYWKVEDPQRYSADNFPTIIGYGNESDLHFYGTPILEYPGLLKVSSYWELKYSQSGEREFLLLARIFLVYINGF